MAENPETVIELIDEVASKAKKKTVADLEELK